MYLYLPLAHSLARIAQAVALKVGGTLVFWGGDPKHIVDEVAETAPTHFPSVPRVYEKIHTAVLARSAGHSTRTRSTFASCSASSQMTATDSECWSTYAHSSGEFVG